MTDYAPDRRTLLAGLGGLAVAGIAGPVAAKQSVGADARLDTLLSAQFEPGLRDDPTRATSLGLDTGSRAALRAQFPDWSAAGRAAQARRIDTDLAAVRAIAADTLGDTARVAHDSAEFDLAARQRLARFTYHSGGFGHRPGPYGVTQLGGFYTGVSTFMDSQHPVKDKADADAYMARLAAIPALLDADTAIVKANAAEFPPHALEMAAQGYCEASYQAFMEDVYIWERKLYRPEPMLCATDGPIAKLRRWYAQFYTDRAKLPKALHNHNHEWTVHDLRDRQAEVIAAQEAEPVSA